MRLKSLLVWLWLCSGVWSVAWAQVQVSGKVTDTAGEPLPGVSVLVQGTPDGVTTDTDGQYRLNGVEQQATIVFRFIGYKTQTVPLNRRTTLNIQLEIDEATLEEVVVVGFGTQKKATLTGAISTMDNKELVQSPVANISNSLIGRLPGLIAVQPSGEPGYDQSRLKIRGIGTLNEGAESDPLVLVDGVPRNFNEIDPNEIENISILKDASATAVFGVRGANGVILVTTRTGKSGKPQISYTANVGLQAPNSLPEMLNSYEYALLHNEAERNMGRQQVYFSDADLEAFRTGSDPIFRPSTDWYDMIIRKTSNQQQHNFNINGGTQQTRYFISAGYFSQNGAYNVNEAQQAFSANPKYQRYNLRSNFDMDFNDNFSASFKLAGQFADMNYPGQSASEIFFRMLRSNPLMNPGIVEGRIIDNVEGLPSNTNNPLSFITSSGFQRNFNSTLNANILLRHKLDFITPGLSARGMLAYDHYYQHRVSRNKWSATYNIVRNPENLAEPVFIRNGEDTPFSFSEGYARNRKIYTEFALDYSRSFGNHTITGLVLYMQEKAHNPTYTYAVPMGYIGTVGRVTYDYGHRYLVELNMGYNGSENFPEDKRFGFFPAFSLGWVVSEESFMPKDGVVNFLKIRGSYGEVGNDKIGGERFLYLPDVFNYGGGYNFGDANAGNAQWYSGSQEGKVGNPNVTWERARKSNLGLELNVADDMFTLVGDVFMERRDNILSYLGTVPDLVQAPLPPANISSVKNRGFEVELGFNHHINSFNYWAKANYTLAKNEIIFMDEPIRPFDYMLRTGQPVGQFFGLRSDGIFNTAEEIANSGIDSWAWGTPQPGDIRYVDLNGDGAIDDYDEAPIGYSTFPRVVYGLSLGFDYKGFDFSVLFQGTDKASFYLNEMAAWPFDTDWGSAQKSHLERWTPERYANGETISFPRVELSPTPNKHNYTQSDFWLKNGRYLRLRNAEVAYRFTGGFLQRLGAQHVRVFANGNNLLTWTNIKYFDPESPTGRGQFYPQMRVYNFGVNVQF